MRGRKITDGVIAALRELYADGLAPAEIALRLGLSATAVRKALHEHTDYSGAPRKCKCSVSQFYRRVTTEVMEYPIAWIAGTNHPLARQPIIGSHYRRRTGTDD